MMQKIHIYSFNVIQLQVKYKIKIKLVLEEELIIVVMDIIQIHNYVDNVFMIGINLEIFVINVDGMHQFYLS